MEAGAHDGKLAADILNWLQSERPKLFDQIEYVHPRTLATAAGMAAGNAEEILRSRVRWISRFNDSTIQRFNGIIFSNELLDAFPVHRFGWDAQEQKMV